MARRAVKTVNLALQGGGSHGAFTWGVLDRLLEVEALRIEGISGTSAGAMNAAVMASGYLQDGPAGARKSLEVFWHGIARLAAFAPNYRSFADQALGLWNVDNAPGSAWADLFGRMFSPYQTNPLNLNPLRQVLEEAVDPAALGSASAIKLFISATNVETGRARVFLHHEVTIDVLLASACLPFTFQAIEIDGAPYWDGGYLGNPAVFPLIYGCDSRDVVLVQINPLLRPGTPQTPMEIANRVNEISFNSSLMAEMRAIAFVQKLIRDDHLKGPAVGRFKDMHIHLIGAEDEMRALGAASKMNAELDFLLHLKGLGRTAADAWLKATWSDLGRRSSIDIRGKFL